MKKNLLELIKNSKEGDDNSFLQIYEKFIVTINKFSNYEDAQSDLTEFLFVLIKKIDLNKFVGKGEGAVIK